MSLVGELQRRKVFKVGAAYLVVGWLLIQVVATVAPQLQLPEWVPRLVTLLLMVGFPVALVMAWVFDVTPEGVRVDARRTGSKRMFAFAALLAVVAVAWYVRGAREPATPRLVATSTPASSAAAPQQPAAAARGPKSIAVLAFTDLSPGNDQEYFSDGIAEEILNALVKVKDLKVAGRTSSFYYKGRNEDLRAIGKALGVAHVLEGSVRKQGERVRITAQLVQVEDGFHLWSETYDGELTDVFELQEQIARAITKELEIVLQGGQQRLVPVATANPDAYAKFLEASAIFSRRDRTRFAEAIALLEAATALDPGFARAHARLAAFHVLSPEYIDSDFDASLDAARRHADRAIALMPTLAEPHTVIGYTHGLRRDHVAEREAYERALALEPADVLSNFWNAISYTRVGDYAGTARRLDRVLELDPMLPNGLTWRGWMYVFAGDTANARRVLDRAIALGIGNAHVPLAFVEHAEGNDVRAAAEMELGLAAFGAALPVESPAIIAAGMYGDDAARRAAIAHIDSLIGARGGKPVPGPLPFALILLDEPVRALEVIQSGVTASSIWQLALWSPHGREARRLPQFAQFARRVGFAALWDRVGPPEGCRREADGDYACD